MSSHERSWWLDCKVLSLLAAMFVMLSTLAIIVSSSPSASNSGLVDLGGYEQSNSINEESSRREVSSEEIDDSSRYDLVRTPEIVETFSSGNGIFIDQDVFQKSLEEARQLNPVWFSETGQLEIQDGAARTNDKTFRMWTWRTDLAYPRVEVDLTFNGYHDSGPDWSGFSMWLNRAVCTPWPGDCYRIDDPDANSGYMLRFIARDGKMAVNKKVGDDAGKDRPGACTGGVHGGVYYCLGNTPWQAEVGETYRFTGEVIRTSDTSNTIRMYVDDELIYEVVDDESKGGPILTSGRLGLRGDSADFTIDDLVVSK